MFRDFRMDSNLVIFKQDGIYVRSVPAKGKGLFCSSPIKQGDVILSEKPIVCCQFSWNRLYQYKACDHCLRSLESAQAMARRLAAVQELELPHADSCCETHRRQIVHCPSCQVEFCSEECLNEAMQKYHRVLCAGDEKENPAHPLNKLDEVWRTSHYPPETATVMLICRMAAMVMQSPEAEKTLKLFDHFFDQVRNDVLRINHKLLGDRFLNQIGAFHQLLREAIPSDVFPRIQSIEGVQSLFALIGMNGQGIGTSSLSQYVHNLDALSMGEADRKAVDMFIDELYKDIDRESGQFLNCEGSGLFQLCSCANHSCSPNAEVTFPYGNSTLVLVALQDIAADEEICICYLDECQRSRSRHSRRKILRENYLFDCFCELCEGQSGELSETSSDDESESDEMDDDDD